jgi:hypothetical protein
MIIGIFIPSTDIDSELKEYDETYKEYLNKYCTSGKYLDPVQKTIKFGILPTGLLAICRTNNLTFMQIIVNIGYWENMTSERRFSTLMHEFSHCYFGLEHSPNPEHFMYAEENHFKKEVVEYQLSVLLQELCK